MLPFIIVGLVTGSTYGLAGVGLVLTYRTTGILNLAHGALGAAAAYFFYQLHITYGLPWPLALLLSVGVFGPVAGVVLERVTVRLGHGSVSTVIVATIGLLLMTQGLLYVAFGDNFRRFPVFLPGGYVTVSGVQVSYAQMITVSITVVITVGLGLFLRRSKTGLTMRAVVQSPELLDLTGVSPSPVRRLAWCIGCSMAALSGVLIAPTISLDAALLSLLVVQAFGAVALARFDNLALTYIGGLAIGVAASLCTKYLGSHPPFNGLAGSVPFLVLIAVLLVVPARSLPIPLGRTGGVVTRPSSLPAAVRRTSLAAMAGLLLLVPLMVGPRLPVYTNALAFITLFLSLALLLNTSGQISLCHAAFVAIGASTFSHLTVDAGIPWFLALLGAGAVVVPVGALLSLPAIRLSGLYLALATFGFGILMQQVVYATFPMFGDAAFLTAPRPTIGSIDGNDDRTFYYVVLSIVVISALVLTAIGRGRLGRLLTAVGDSPTALVTLGLSVNVSKAIAFCISGFFAGIAGALFIAQTGTASRDVGFGPLQSLTWLAVLAITGGAVVRGSALAAVLLVILPSYLTEVSQSWQLIIFGGSALLVSVFLRTGIDYHGRLAHLARQSEGRRRYRLTRAQGHSDVVGAAA